MPRCSQCNLSFTRSSTLKRHSESKHAHERGQHRCLDCDEYFARYDILIRHGQNCHGAGKLTCKHCSQAFRSDHLLHHTKRCKDRRKVHGQIVSRDLSVAPSSAVGASAFSSDLPKHNRQDVGQLNSGRESVTEAQKDAMVLLDGADQQYYGAHSRFQVTGVALEQSAHVQTQYDPPSIHWINQYSLPRQAVNTSRVVSGPEVLVSHSSETEVQQSHGGHTDTVRSSTSMKVEIRYRNLLTRMHQPPCPPFLTEAAEILQDEYPAARLEEKMHLCPDVNSLRNHGEPDVATTRAAGNGKDYAPAIECLDCQDAVFTVSPACYPTMLAEHLNSPSHNHRLRLRWISESNTAKQAVRITTGYGGVMLRKALEDLRCTRFSIFQLEDHYFALTGQTILMLAVQNDAGYVLEHLLDEGLKPTKRDTTGRSALHWVCTLKRFNMAELMIYRGARLEDRDGLRQTPLDLAVQSGDIDAAVRLIEIETKMLQDATPLARACRYGYLDIIEKMLQNHIYLDALDLDLSLDIALCWAPWKAVQLLLEAGASTMTVSPVEILLLLNKRDGKYTGPKAAYRDAAEKLSLLQQDGLNLERIQRS